MMHPDNFDLAMRGLTLGLAICASVFAIKIIAALVRHVSLGG